MRQLKSIFLFLIIIGCFFSSAKMNCMQESSFINIAKKNKLLTIVSIVGLSYLAYKVLSSHFSKSLQTQRNIENNEFDDQGPRRDFELKSLNEEILHPVMPIVYSKDQCNLGLIQAIEKRDIESTKFFLAKGADFTIKVLLEALKKDLKIFKVLIEKWGINLPQKLKNMYLQYAIQIEKNVDLASSLINAKADINMVDCEGRSLLHLAIIEKNSEVIDLLIKKGITVNTLITKKHLIGKNETMPILNYLIKDVNKKNNKGDLAKQYKKSIEEGLGECMICLESNKLEKKIGCVVLLCNHIFHEDCIAGWANKNLTCPICKTPFDLFRVRARLII